MYRLFRLKINLLILFIGIIFLSLNYPLSITHSQSIPSVIGGLELTPSTNNPLPGQKVTITAQSYSTDINSAKITWSVNGKVVQSGIGINKLEVTAPVLGKKTSISVTITTPNGQKISNNISINSGSIDMIIESDGYMPPLFQGKIYPAYQNNIKIIAIPHLSTNTKEEIDPTKLVYQWKKNDQVIQDQSGYGKNFVTIAGDIIPRPFTITVTASSQDGVVSSTNSIQIEQRSPSINFYINDSLYGLLFNKIVGSSIKIDKERRVSVLAVPFGFNKSPSNIGSLALSWTINGLNHPELSSSDSVVLRAPEGQSGYSDIQLDIKNPDKILQNAVSGFSTFFTANKTPSNTNVVF